ncbi:rhomboid family intramembrane serine protease, partial [Mycobacterium tuberculosis]|uniref:rhomboid family intramembrane serine protease n=1 Tax=Mycobacterium tuberculosis TaxID=1773 RepID=UPI000D31CD46
MKKITWNSPVILSFALISLIALGLNTITNGTTNYLIFSVYGGSLLNPLFYLRLFTHVLGHADLSHYMNNKLLFLLVGPMLEEKYGSQRLLIVILVVALVTGIAHIIIAPHTMLLGASGVVFAFILLS